MQTPPSPPGTFSSKNMALDDLSRTVSMCVPAFVFGFRSFQGMLMVPQKAKDPPPTIHTR